MRKGNKFSLIGSTAGLALAGIVSKIIGACYRIPLTNVLGAEGIGLYQTFFPVYALFLTLTSGALPTVVSRYVAYGDALGIEIPKTRGAAKKIAFAFGLAGFFALSAFSWPLAALQSRASLWSGYLIIAPAVFAVSLCAYYKGVFIGKGIMTANAFTQTAEQAVKLAVGLTAAFFLAKKGVVYAVYGALAAVTVSEFCSLAIMAVCYRVKFGKDENLRAGVDKVIYYDVIKSTLPLIGSALVLPLLGFVDSFMIVRLLTASGLPLSQATAQYGLFGGAVSTIINLPVVVAISMAVAVIPRVSSCLAKGEYVKVKDATANVVTICALIVVPCFFGLYVFAPDITALLYPGFDESYAHLTADLLRIQSLNVISVSLVQIIAGILQATGSGGKVLFYTALAGVFKVALQAVAVYYIGITGAPLSQIAMYAVLLSLLAIRYRETVGKNPKLFQSISKILASGVIMSVGAYATVRLTGGGILRLVVGISVCAALYCISVLGMRVTDFKKLIAMSKGA